MKSLRNDRPPATAPHALSIVVVDRCPADYIAASAAPRLGVGWQFVTCGREALRTARARAVDLWVVNVSLPDMSGLDLCRMLRERRASTSSSLPTGTTRTTSGPPAFSAPPCSPASRSAPSGSTGTILASHQKTPCFTRAARLNRPTQITKPRKIIRRKGGEQTKKSMRLRKFDLPPLFFAMTTGLLEAASPPP